MNFRIGAGSAEEAGGFGFVEAEIRGGYGGTGRLTCGTEKRVVVGEPPPAFQDEFDRSVTATAASMERSIQSSNTWIIIGGKRTTNLGNQLILVPGLSRCQNHPLFGFSHG